MHGTRLLHYLLITVGNATPGKIVRRNLYDNLITREDTDIIHPNLAGDCAKDGLAVL